MTSSLEKFDNRRTFAIISHPDAGKTTLTEKLLLFGGAIKMAGSVKGKKAAFDKKLDVKTKRDHNRHHSNQKLK